MADIHALSGIRIRDLGIEAAKTRTLDSAAPELLDMFNLNYIIQSYGLKWVCHVERMQLERTRKQLMEEHHPSDARCFVGKTDGTD